MNDKRKMKSQCNADAAKQKLVFGVVLRPSPDCPVQTIEAVQDVAYFTFIFLANFIFPEAIFNILLPCSLDVFICTKGFGLRLH